MTKQLLLTITLLLCAYSNAQITVEKSSERTLDEMLKDIDKTDFTSGILVDRSGNYANLTKLNSSEKSISINYAYFKQAILDLHIASNKEKFISSKALKERLEKNNQKGDIVDIGIISADFHSLNYQFGKETGNGLKLEGKVFKQVKNKEAFLHHNSLVASPLKIAAKGTTITYRFQDKFWFNSSKKDIKNLTAHFQNGGKFTIIENGKIIRKELQQSYTKNGEKMITFTAIYSDNSQLTCKSKIY